jgi:hypothetical protein
MLRLSLNETRPGEGLPLRQGGAIGVRQGVGRAALHQLILAIRSAIGIETPVRQTDVAPPDQGHAVELMSWSAHELQHADVH